MTPRRPNACWSSRALGASLVASLLTASCHTPDRPALPPEPTASQYHADTFSWAAVSRVLVLPVLNESAHTRAGDEVGRALSIELQQLGRFEVVAPPAGHDARLAAQVHRGGRFDEAVMLDLAHAARADVILHGTVTTYSPYPRPRLGLVLQAVSPAEGKVVASVDGLWDATQRPVEVRAKLYYHQLPGRHPWVANNVIAPNDGYADELALDSPMLFQRFVCHEAVATLVTGEPTLRGSLAGVAVR